MPELGRLAGDLELDLTGFGRVLCVLDVVARVGGRFAGFGRAAGVLVLGVALGAGRFADFGGTVGVLVLDTPTGVGRLTDFGRAPGAGPPSRWPGFGDGLEAVGCSRVCRGRAILR